MSETIEAQLVGKLVATEYNNTIYRVEAVHFNKNPLSTFHDDRSNREVTYKEYYKSRYNLNIVDPKQPLLLVVHNRRK